MLPSLPEKNPGSLAVTNGGYAWGRKTDSARAAQGLEDVKALNSMSTCSKEILGRRRVVEVG